ncbi:phage holin family protein [Microbacterium sediminis]|uniref:Uncharacterized protein n=1 Tax=Microbacterium sediminis TaxID=904291 RepID=A0A1B9N9I9_9MICO|nr:phage holin family protein [Microbacterium sediminis]OCG73263.1 hypothetical protein A7J15_08135 [Microbacterium sediminis]QBR75152.1 phage holin family protein [Microbacterium sediminis]
MTERTTRSPLRDRADDGLFTLIGDLPELVSNLVKAEVRAVKGYVGQLVKHGGLTAVFAIVALFFLFWTIPAFLAFFVILLDLWMPLWVAALIVVVIGIVLAVLAALWGYVRHVRKIQKLESPATSVKKDAGIVKEFADEF